MTFSTFPRFVFSFGDFSGNVGILPIVTYMWHAYVAVLTKNKGLIRPQMTVLEHIWLGIGLKALLGKEKNPTFLDLRF